MKILQLINKQLNNRHTKLLFTATHHILENIRCNVILDKDSIQNYTFNMIYSINDDVSSVSMLVKVIDLNKGFEFKIDDKIIRSCDFEFKLMKDDNIINAIFKIKE